MTTSRPDPHGAERWRAIHAQSAPSAPATETATRRVLVLSLVTMAVEIVAGYTTGSMALVADGWHMGSHALAMGIAYAVHVAAKTGFIRKRMSFGPGKLSALGGYTSALLLAAVAVLAGIQSAGRLVWPAPIAFGPAIAVACVGLLVNGASFWMLRGPPGGNRTHAHDHVHAADPNHRAAVAHVLADALTSVLAVAALAGGRIFGWNALDPAIGLAGSLLVAYWAARLLESTARTLLDFTPASGVEAAVRELIAKNYDAVVADVHVWEFAPHKLACALSISAHEPVEPAAVRATLEQLSDLAHVTVEVNHCREEH